MRLKKRFRGALLGLAACDAVGTTLEFLDPGSFAPITDMVGGGPFDLNPGEWTKRRRIHSLYWLKSNAQN